MVVTWLQRKSIELVIFPGVRSQRKLGHCKHGIVCAYNDSSRVEIHDCLDCFSISALVTVDSVVLKSNMYEQVSNLRFYSLACRYWKLHFHAVNMQPISNVLQWSTHYWV